MNENELKKIIEAVIYAADEPMSLNRLISLFPEEGHPGRDAIKNIITQLQDEAAERSVELKEVGSGYRYQVRQDYAEWVSKLWEERPARYSRASLETLALIAYRQPVTRAEIEEVRSASVHKLLKPSLNATGSKWLAIVMCRASLRYMLRQRVFWITSISVRYRICPVWLRSATSTPLMKSWS